MISLYDELWTVELGKSFWLKLGSVNHPGTLQQVHGFLGQGQGCDVGAF